MDSMTGEWKKMNQALKTSDKPRGSPVTQMIVSPDNKYFACCDQNRAVSLFKKDHLHGDPSKPIEW